MEKTRAHILFALLIAMMAGLFFSRALLSVSVIVFSAISLLHPNYKLHIREFLHQPLCWGTSLLFFIPLLTGLWSADRSQWLQMMQVKLPLFFLPMAFAWPLAFSEKHWRWLMGLFVLLIIGGAAYYLLDYFEYRYFYDLQYLKGRLLDTPLENDHVRFSLLVFVAIVFSGYQYYLGKTKQLAWVWIVFICLLVAYLHILAARTGLLAFYVSLAGWVIYLFKKARPAIAIAMISLLILIPLSAWFLMPSFQNKWRLFRYESSYFLHGSYSPSSNDMIRVISIKAGWHLLRSNPVMGTGYGDILKESRDWYAINYPSMREDDRIYPSSQFLLFGAGTGVLGLIVFCLLMAAPFTMRMNAILPWRMITLGLASSYLFDIGLEVQYGVFLHCFILFLSWQWMKRQNITSL